MIRSGSGWPGGVQLFVESLLVNLVSRNAGGHHGAGRVDDLGSTREVEGDVERHALAAAGRSLCGPNRAHDVSRCLMQAPDDAHSNALRHQLVGVLAHGPSIRPRSPGDLVLGAPPVLRLKT
jgi:hypothetical protein